MQFIDKQNQHILEDMLFTFGLPIQSTITIEELSELQKEICKMKRNNLNFEHMAEELAHVYLTIQYLVIGLHLEREVTEEYNKAIQRAIKILKEVQK